MKHTNKNEKFYAYKILVILIVSFSLAFTSISSAFGIAADQAGASNSLVADNVASTGDINVFSRQYNWLYQRISDNDYIFTPMSAGVAGWSLCGGYCAFIGIGVGSLDEFLRAYCYTDKRYLTWLAYSFAGVKLLKVPFIEKVGSDIVLAVVMMIPDVHAEHLDLIKERTAALGAVVVTSAGLIVMAMIKPIIPDELLANHAGKAIAPIAGAAAGAKAFGTVGAVGGLVLGLADELMVANNITDARYLTWVMVPTSVLHSFGFGPSIVHGVGPVAGLIAAGNEDKIVSQTVAPVKTIYDLYDIYSDLIPKEQLDNHLEKQAQVLFAIQLITQVLDLKTRVHMNDVRHQFEGLSDNRHGAWEKYRSEITGFAVFLLFYVPGQIISDKVEGFFSKSFEYAVEDNIRGSVLQGEIPLRLLNNTNSTVSLDNLRVDVSTITQGGAMLITGAVRTVLQGAAGGGVVLSGTPNIFLLSASYSQIENFISVWVRETESEYRAKTVELESKRITNRKHVDDNIRVIIERDGIDFEERRQQEIEDEIRELETKAEMVSGVLTTWMHLSSIANHIMQSLIVAHEIHSGRLDFKDRVQAQIGSSQLSSFFAWPGRSAGNVASIGKASERIKLLKDQIDSEPSDEDRIERIAAEGNRLIFKDVEIGIEDRHLVTASDIALDVGKVYAVTGGSGCGKSSFLSKLKGIKENGVSGSGKIYYPQVDGKFPKIIHASQKNYFPTRISFLEQVYYPDRLPEDGKLREEKEKEMIYLLEKLGLNKSAEDAESLSGGEKKRALLVSAIIKKPDILILDETLAGIDQFWLIKAKGLLNEYLPNTLILVVDHEAKNHEYLYDGQLHFANKEAVLHETCCPVDTEFDEPCK